MSRTNALWTICLAFALYTVSSGLLPGTVPAGIDGMMLTAFVLVFALVHGAQRYGWRGILMFVVICLVVSNASENLSILTGVPFGHYYYTDVLGPKLLLVPVLIGGAYAGAGYLSWMLAHVLLDRTGSSTRLAVWALPVIGAVLMVSWDMAFDPSASTMGKAWIWTEGGGFFGVPVQNFVGWFLTVVLFLALFSWYQSTRPVESLRRNYWAQAVTMYFLLGLRYPLLYASSRESRPVTDAAGHVWHTGDIRATSALVAMFTMIAFALVAGFRLCDRPK